jgi:Fe-S cluster assembly protein SufB
MSQVFDREQQEYSAGFHVAENYAYKAPKGLTRTIVEQISEMKGEPDWMRKFRLKSLDLFEKRPMPTWGADLSGIDFDNIYYYIKPVVEQGRTWEDVPVEIKVPLIAWASRRPSANSWPASQRSTKAKRSITRCAKTWKRSV